MNCNIELSLCIKGRTKSIEENIASQKKDGLFQYLFEFKILLKQLFIIIIFKSKTDSQDQCK